MKLDLVYFGYDWMGLYVDGILKKEGHSIPVWEVADALGIKCETWNAKSSEDDLFMPEKFKDLKHE